MGFSFTITLGDCIEDVQSIIADFKKNTENETNIDILNRMSVLVDEVAELSEKLEG